MSLFGRQPSKVGAQAKEKKGRKRSEDDRRGLGGQPAGQRGSKLVTISKIYAFGLNALVFVYIDW
ncbi:hypothetical protein DBR09_13920 [Aeromonas sp. HMWF016]|nr:hypothetical protein DBR09_13920 [Aeromonas sp. HMWF016]